MPLRESTLALIFVLAVSYVASACSCATSGTCEFKPTADVIFLGTVIDQQTGEACHGGECSSDYPQTTTFLVREAFRGVAVQKVEIDTGAGICTYPFEVGQSYVVFADRYKGKLSTTKCSGTRAEVVAGALIQQLRAWSSGLPMPSLFGSVRLAPAKDAYDLRGEIHYKPESGITVRINDTAGRQFAATTDNDGAYAFREVPAGDYQIGVDPPVHTTTSNLVKNRPRPVKVTTAVACQQDIDLWWDGRISGRVVDQQGKPVMGFVSLMWADMPGESLREKEAGLPGDDVQSDGRFEFTLLSPGHYRLRFRHTVDSRFVRGLAYGYGPVVTLQEGEHRDGIVFVVPALDQLPAQP